MNQADPTRLIVTNEVLKKLGFDLYEVVKYHLGHHYKISLDKFDEPFDLKAFEKALKNLIGMGAAEMIIQDVHTELQERGLE